MNCKSILSHRAEKALEIIRSDVFVKQWKNLAIGRPVHCRMQEADILSVWYPQYSEVLEPVIFIAYNDADELVGFLGMAWDKKNKEIIHAGHPQYRGWLAIPDYELSFLKEVFQLIKREFQIKKLEWSVLSPGLSIDVFKSALGSDMHMTYEETEAPMWNLKDPARLKKLLKNKSIKANFNRYKRQGDFRFEIIDNPDRLREILNIAKNQIDFRKEAINNSLPFQSDPNKIDYFCEQFLVPGTILPVALWLDDQLLSFNQGVMAKNHFTGRITSFDPSEYRYSPGTLLFIRLAEYLTEKGYETFDLTPGTNSYKDRFADTRVKLYKPTIHFSTINYQSTLLKQKLVKGSRKLIIDKMGVDIKSYRKWKTNLEELPQKIKKIGKGKIQGNITKKTTVNKQAKLIHLERANFPLPIENGTKQVVSQQYEDLRKYKGTQPFLTRRGLLIDALNKFAKGDILYSVANDEKLLWYVWRKKAKGAIKYNNASIPVEKDGILLYDLYQTYSPKDKEYINDITEIIPLLDLKEVDNIYMFETAVAKK